MDICGNCGHNVANAENGTCNSCGRSNWVQPEDFDNEFLIDHIKDAVHTLDIDYWDLRTIVIEDDKELYAKWHK